MAQAGRIDTAGIDIPNINPQNDGLGGFDVSALGSVNKSEFSGAPVDSTFNFDPTSITPEELAGSAPAETDVDLAQPRVKPEAAGTVKPTFAGQVAGGVAKEAINVFSNLQTIKANDAVFMNKIQRGFENLEFNQRLVRVDRDISALQNTMKAMEDLKRQAGNPSAGGQQSQLFLRDPLSGRNV